MAVVMLGGYAHKAKAEAGQALSISPPLVEVKSDPGKLEKVSIKVTNLSSGELLVKNQVNDFGAKNESGEPNIIFDDNQNEPYSLRNWVEAPAPFKLASQQSRVVEFKINVPTNAEPGGHYAVFRFTGQAPELEQSGVALSASIGSLILLRVSGNVSEQANLVSFYSASRPQFSKSGFFENGPIGFVERVQNNGNIHVQPTGTITIKDMFGRQVASLRVNGEPASKQNPPRSVLPKSIRKFEQIYDKKWLFGYYSATLDLTYGSTNQTLRGTTGFWVIPYKLVLLALLIVVVLVLLARWLLRRYKAHVVKQIQKSQEQNNGSDRQTKNLSGHKKVRPKKRSKL